MVSTLKEFAIGVCLATTTAKRQKNINEFDLYTIYAKGLVQISSPPICNVGLDRAKAGGRNSVTQRFKKGHFEKFQLLLKKRHFL